MSWFSDVVDDVVDTVTDTVDAVGDAVSDAVEDVKDAGEDFVDDVKDTWNDAMSDVTSAMEDGGFLGATVAVIGGILSGVVGTIGNIVDVVVDVAGAIVGGAIGVAGSVVGGALRLGIIIGSFGLLSDFAKDVGRFFAEGGRQLGDWIADGFNLAGDFVERLFDIGATFIQDVFRKVRCIVRAGVGAMKAGFESLGQLLDGSRSVRRRIRGIERVNHFFVLMLENRSFDHMLGLSPIAGLDGINSKIHFNISNAGQQIYASGGAKLSLAADPPHEFAYVQKQLFGGPTHPNGGFVQAFEDKMKEDSPFPFKEQPEQVMRAFEKERLPILHKLAEEFAVCDAWFSSLPGPTLPNRLFAHAATSGGLADSPSGASLAWAMTLGGFEFEHGTIFDRLDTKCLAWRVYAGDSAPLVMTLKGVVTQDAVNGFNRIRPLSNLASDLASDAGGFPPYVFIEPNYGKWWSDFKGGSSQHPLDSVAGGELLIKELYENLRASKIWNSSALIITYDEHGGFYDHRVPPVADPPADERDYANWADDPVARQFQFDRLGVRVPAVIVSPLIERGIVDHTIFDHSSILATLARRFGFRTLTKRDLAANTFGHLFSRESPRTDTPAILPAVFQG